MAEGLGPALGYFTTIAEIGVLKTFIDHKVFDHIPSEGSISISSLAEKVNGEVEILERLTAYLVAAGFLSLDQDHRVSHTAKSLTYRSDEIPAGFLVHVFNLLLRPIAHLPAYFAQHGFASPKHANTTPFGLATGHPDLTFYETLDAEPKLAEVFNGFIGRAGRLWPMTGVYDFGWMKDKISTHENRALIVDIGGSNGLAIRDILNDHHFIPASRCAVFDLQKSLETTKINLDPALLAVNLVGGSMFEPFPQAVQGAMVYQFRRILNDYPDDDVIRAWKNLRAAAVEDTRVYVVEELLPSGQWPSAFSGAQDVAVMLIGGKRRNAEMHAKLAGVAGFRLGAQFEDTRNKCGVLEFLL